jgi:phosphotransferase system HPr (HPr) family protein
MQTVEITLRNPSGLHARPAANFVKAAKEFTSSIKVENVTRGSAPGNAKSMLNVLACGVAKGHVVRLTIDGADEEAAAKALSEAIASGLGEAVD